ncbi:Transposable element Tcb1 transposase [Araneus ventricosus]|uniref:Transposable element Tcb1 transposase n=1 Tax=Araneus ventricosus TaxID=182803 RepID=A0A4Y2EYH0_ARAVE|nr:Transposable element Tcb1 transposase [Araneus ventricosus]
MGKIWFFQMYACTFECLALSLPNANFKGNFKLLNLDGKTFGIIRMREILVLSFLNTLTTFGPRCSICIRAQSRHHLPKELRWRDIERLEAGQSQTEVVRWLNVSPSVVRRLWKQFLTADSASRKFSQGRPTATTSDDDRCLSLCARRNRTATPTQLRSSLAAATGRLVSMTTVHRRLHEGGLCARQPAICVPLTSRHGRERLRWAHQHVHWTPDHWRAILFTDESRLSLQSDSRCYLIWREPGTRYHPSNIRERDAYGGGRVCVWGGISLGGRTDLHVFPRGTVNAQAYTDDIRDSYVLSYAGAIGDYFLLQDDNARRHRARIVDDYLQQETIQHMVWPVRSPSLNHFAHVWDALGRRLSALNPPPQTLATLATALREQWLSLPTELIDSIIDSITHRCMC